MNLSGLLPPVSARYRGSPLALCFLVLFAVTGTVRSLIHILAPDGGAGTIAGLTIQVDGGGNLVAIFAQWGASQLILALLTWLVVLRYRFLVPAMLAVVTLEQALRIGVGLLKPLDAAAAPPGAIGSTIVLPLALIALALSLRRTPRVL
ncbi:MAG: hypothetical protein ACP5HG_16620 [Anaerolineae bacterium]